MIGDITMKSVDEVVSDLRSERSAWGHTLMQIGAFVVRHGPRLDAAREIMRAPITDLSKLDAVRDLLEDLGHDVLPLCETIAIRQTAIDRLHDERLAAAPAPRSGLACEGEG